MTSNPLSTLFRSNSISQPSATGFPTPLATSMLDNHRRRVSVTTFGLPGTSPTNTFSFFRRASVSTNSDSFDESAIEEGDDVSRTAPTTPFARRMSLGAAQAMRGMRGGNSPGANDQGFNWSDQLRSRAENTVAQGVRPSVSFASSLGASPPRGGPPTGPASTSVSPHHDRARSVSDMPAPPAQSRPRAPQKPDHFQERILKGDFYMD
jgi:hypothetical protein